MVTSILKTGALWWLIPHLCILLLEFCCFSLRHNSLSDKDLSKSTVPLNLCNPLSAGCERPATGDEKLVLSDENRAPSRKPHPTKDFVRKITYEILTLLCKTNPNFITHQQFYLSVANGLTTIFVSTTSTKTNPNKAKTNPKSK